MAEISLQSITEFHSPQTATHSSMSRGQENLPPNVVRKGDQDVPKTPVPIPKPAKVISFPLNCTWSNDASGLELATYFDPDKPNLALDFGLDGLQPVICQIGGDVFLLQENSGKFYKWSN
jgi:hypothetical protein